jgi:hypothetical protein
MEIDQDDYNASNEAVFWGGIIAVAAIAVPCVAAFVLIQRKQSHNKNRHIWP